MLIESFEKTQFSQTKISILVKIFKKISNFGRIFENLEFGWNFRKISILVEIFENLDFGRNFRKITILVEILDNQYFGG